MWSAMSKPITPRRVGVTITVRVEPPTLQVFGDKVLLAQVLGNLVRNAVEATAQRARREVTITARRHADASQVEIVLRDTGPGLPAKLRKRSLSLSRPRNPRAWDRPRNRACDYAVAWRVD